MPPWGRLRALGIEPVIGLMHHGSGPPHTSLLKDSLPQGLAAFAAQVARRYPWVRFYTPVNEPLTTARFSCLYGHWYPHASSDTAFVRALLIQVRAIGQAMEAIRAINPAARLVQTEDLGYTQAAPALQEQAGFENERRWLSFDLLAGRVTPAHPLYAYLRANSATVAQLASLAHRPCPPDTLGINHYITSERYLDDRLHLHPPHAAGGNGRQRYVDVETCRSCEERIGPAALLGQAWRRYGIPLAVTEAHIGCEPAEQMRWFYQMWQACLAARDAGAEIGACTAWALLGSYDWDSLLTQPNGRYEPGVFETAPSGIYPTDLAALMYALAHGQPVSPLVREPGWWQRRHAQLEPESA